MGSLSHCQFSSFSSEHQHSVSSIKHFSIPLPSLSLALDLAHITSDQEATTQKTPHKRTHSYLCSHTGRSAAKKHLGGQKRDGGCSCSWEEGRKKTAPYYTSAGWRWDDGRRHHLGIIPAVWILPFVPLLWTCAQLRDHLPLNPPLITSIFVVDSC